MNRDIIEIDAFIQKKFREKEKKIQKYVRYVNSVSRLQTMSFPEKIRKDIADNIKRVKDYISDAKKNVSYDYYVLYSTPIIERYKKLLIRPLTIDFMGMRPVDYKEKNCLIRQYYDLLKRINIDFNDNSKEVKEIKREISIRIPTDISERSERKERKKICKEQGDCPNCGKNEFESIDDRTFVCLNCGIQQETIPTSIVFRDNSHIMNSNKYTYLRRVHFKDAFNQFQGKQNCIIDPIVYEKLERELDKHYLLVGDKNTPRKTRYDRVTLKHIFLFLKEIGYSKHYENATLIYHNLTGKEVPDISYLEDRLLSDFDTLSNAYDELFMKTKRIQRSSFLNIQYVLLQLLRKNGYNCSKENFNMLKTSEKKQFHDEVCKELFEKLNWNFTPVW